MTRRQRPSTRLFEWELTMRDNLSYWAGRARDWSDEFGVAVVVFGIPAASAVTLLTLLGWWFS